MARDPILTVGVPTFNRPGMLPRLVGGIIAQAEACGAETAIEIVVCDNSLDIASEAALAPYLGGRVAVRYIRNERNLGMVRNILLTLQHARGRYWMLYGDDDEMAGGALAGILEELTAPVPPPVVVFRGEPCMPQYDFAQREELTLAETIHRLFYYMGNAGRLTVRRDLANRSVIALGDEQWTCWPQTEVALVAMALSGEARPLVLSPTTTVYVHHSENAVYTAYHLAETPVLSLLRAAHHVAPWIGPRGRAEAERYLLSRDRMNAYRTPIVMYKTFSDLPEDVRAFRAAVTETLLHHATCHSFPYLISIWLLAYSPRWLDRLLVRLYAIARYRRRWRAALAEWAGRYSRQVRVAAAAGAPDAPRAHTRDDLTW